MNTTSEIGVQSRTVGSGKPIRAVRPGSRAGSGSDLAAPVPRPQRQLSRHNRLSSVARVSRLAARGALSGAGRLCPFKSLCIIEMAQASVLSRVVQ